MTNGLPMNVRENELRQVLECASPLALWMGTESARGLAHSRKLPRYLLTLLVFGQCVLAFAFLAVDR